MGYISGVKNDWNKLLSKLASNWLLLTSMWVTVAVGVYYLFTGTHWEVDSIVETGFFTLGGAIVGTVGAGIISNLTSKEQNSSEEKRLEIQLAHERTQTTQTYKRDTYALAAAVLFAAGVSIIENKFYPGDYGEEETRRYHEAINALRLVESPEVKKAEEDLFALWPDKLIADSTVRMEKGNAVKLEVEKLRQAMRRDLGLSPY
jgi:hypothetical protein